MGRTVQVKASRRSGFDAAGGEGAPLRQARQHVAVAAVPVLGGENGGPRGRRGGGRRPVEHEAGRVGREGLRIARSC